MLCIKRWLWCTHSFDMGNHDVAFGMSHYWNYQCHECVCQCKYVRTGIHGGYFIVVVVVICFRICTPKRKTSQTSYVRALWTPCRLHNAGVTKQKTTACTVSGLSWWHHLILLLQDNTVFISTQECFFCRRKNDASCFVPLYISHSVRGCATACCLTSYTDMQMFSA